MRIQSVIFIFSISNCGTYLIFTTDVKFSRIQAFALSLVCVMSILKNGFFQMVAKGKNASHLFPAVVKNVASKNIEVKKLVYVYLERYAEEQQDLALLSIATFQRGLKVQCHLLLISVNLSKMGTTRYT